MKKTSVSQKAREYIRKNPGASPESVAVKFNISKNYVYVLRNEVKKEGVNIDSVHAGSLPDFIPAPVKTGGAAIDFATSKQVEAPKPDMVNSPPHYTDGGIETIDFIEAKRLDYHLGNVVKYVTRADKKGGMEDLLKAQWYLNRAIEKRSNV